MSDWTNVDAGPIQAKRVQKALQELPWEGRTFVQLSGIIGNPDSERRTTLTQFGAAIRDDAKTAIAALGEQFGWQVTKANYQQIVAAAAAAAAELQKNRPVEDQRIAADVDAERRAATARREAEQQATRAAAQALADQALAVKPAGAAALIVAILKQDTSDIASDYSGNNSVRTVAIGWRFGDREDFRQLRAAAGRYAPTAHLGPDADADIEHRDNYSMGAGNYLSDHGWDGAGSGWVVKSMSGVRNLTELALPDQVDQPAGTPVRGVTVRPSSIGRDGVVEIVFDDKPSVEVRAALKSHGFRWAGRNRCWYGRNETYANSLVNTASDE